MQSESCDTCVFARIFEREKTPLVGTCTPTTSRDNSFWSSDDRCSAAHLQQCSRSRRRSPCPQDDVKALLTGVRGFRSWGLVRTDNGGLSVTTCDTAAGCAETVTLAADWISKNLADQRIAPPTVYEGETLITFATERPREANPHVVIALFSDPPPPSVKEHESGLREAMRATPGFRGWHATPTTAGGGFLVMVAEDKAGSDDMMRRLIEFNEAHVPDVAAIMAARPPQIIEGEGVNLIRVAGAVPA
jgi:hypothetical protein